MDVERIGSAREFLEASADYRDREPLRTNVMATVAALVEAGVSGGDDGYWWVVRDAGEVVGSSMRTPPNVHHLGPMADGPARALARGVLAVDHDAPGVAGSPRAVAAFLEASRATGGRGVVATQHQLLYEVPVVTLPQVEGRLVVADVDDVSLAEAWSDAFADEVEGGHARPRSDEQRRVLREHVRQGRVHFWSVEGRHVAMAGTSPSVVTASSVVSRVGPVYTPPELRGRGYGASVTGTVSQLLLDRGSRVMLYADEANATSNRIYRALGYEPVDRFVRHTFSASR